MTLKLEIPGRGHLQLEGLLCDMNGTLTVDGQLSALVRENLRRTAAELKIYVMTADTFGTAERTFADLPVELISMPNGVSGDLAKRDFLRDLGADFHAALGNGRNDRLMLAEAALGVCILGREGAHRLTMTEADLIVADPVAALELFLKPGRLVAGLRN